MRYSEIRGITDRKKEIIRKLYVYIIQLNEFLFNHFIGTSREFMKGD